MQKKLSNSVQIFYPKFNKETLIKEIEKSLKSLAAELPLRMVVLFGSYAKEDYTAASDVDLLVVYEGEEQKDAFMKVKKILNIDRLEPHTYTNEQYHKNKEVIDKMIAKGEVLTLPKAS